MSRQILKLERYNNDGNDVPSTIVQKINENFEEVYGDGIINKSNIVGGILRTAADGNWTLLDDGNHQPINIDSVVTSSSTITINYGKTFSKVRSFCVTPDELLSRELVCGASVGLSSTLISLHSIGSVGGYIYYNGSSWSKIGTVGIGTPSFAAGILTLPIPEYVGGLQAQVSCRDGAHIVNVGTSGAGSILVSFHDYAGSLVTTPDTGMKIRLTCGPDQSVDPMKITTTDFLNGNLWVYGVLD